jgi:ribosomal protein S3AE
MMKRKKPYMQKKMETLQKKFKKEFDKYFKAMSYRIMSVEVYALYNVLVLKKESKYELTRRWEAKVRDILNIEKPE